MSISSQYPLAISAKYSVKDMSNWVDIRFDTFVPVFNNETKLVEPVQLWQIYEDQVKGWYLDIVSEIHSEHAGFVKLMVAIAFFEANAQFLYGVDTSEKHDKSKLKSSKCTLKRLKIRTFA